MPQCWEVNFPNVSEEDIREFACASKESNPIHRDNDVAREQELLGIVALNTMVDNYFSDAIAREIPKVRVMEKTVRYRNPLYAGSSPSVTCVVTWKKMRLAKVSVVVKNCHEIIAEGECLLFLPPASKQSTQATGESTAT